MTHRGTDGRWEGSEVLRGAETVDRAKATPWGALRYAADAALVLAAATALAGPIAGVVAASGAINAGAVGVNSGLSRPRLVMAVSLVALSAAAFLGCVTGSVPPLAVATIAALGVVAGLLARAGKAASVVGVQAMVGFVTLGRFPGPPSTAALVALGIVAGGVVQIALGEILRLNAIRGVIRRLPTIGPVALQPLRPFEDDVERDTDEGHDGQRQRVSERPG